jgi:8-oxo-dGTP pyrophosphatase MutT (NUDIX family)
MNIYPMIIYQGRVFAVELDNVWLASGKEAHYATIRHPPSVILIPIQDDGKIVLISQYRHALARKIWEVPAGGVNPGETPDAAAARECEEEIRLVPTKIERIGGFFPAPGYCDEEMIFYRVSGLKTPPPDSPVKPDEDEDIESRAMTIAEAKAMVTRGEIIDLKTAYALSLL